MRLGKQRDDDGVSLYKVMSSHCVLGIQRISKLSALILIGKSGLTMAILKLV